MAALLKLPNPVPYSLDLEIENALSEYFPSELSAPCDFQQVKKKSHCFNTDMLSLHLCSQKASDYVTRITVMDIA